MKVHSEANVEGQIQELKTITRLQGEPYAWDRAPAHPDQGLLAQAFKFNTRTPWDR